MPNHMCVDERLGEIDWPFPDFEDPSVQRQIADLRRDYAAGEATSIEDFETLVDRVLHGEQVITYSTPASGARGLWQIRDYPRLYEAYVRRYGPTP